MINIKPSHKGLLSKALHVPQDEDIPANKLKKAMSSKSVKMRKRAQFAMNAKKWSHGVKKFNSNVMNGPLSGGGDDFEGM